MPDRYDIAIVGAGPAGAMAAHACARRGAAVLLLDKARFPRAKVCGGCLGGEALDVLDRAGLAALPTQCHARPLHTLRLAASQRTADLPLAAGLALSRHTFDHALVRAAITAGATFADATTATLTTAVDAPQADHQLALRHDHAQRDVRARVLLVADGIAGTCLADHPAFAWRIARRARVGFGTVVSTAMADYAPGIIHMAVGPHGYLGVVRVEGDQLDIAGAVDASFVQAMQGPAGAAAQLLADAGLPPIPDLPHAPWRGTPWLTRQRHRVAAPGLFVVGDAAGYVEPFTGEGLGWALHAAEAAAPLALDAVVNPTADTARRWSRTHHRLFAARRRRCRLIAAALRRPALVRVAMTLLDRRPSLARSITRRLAMGA
ncbi:MAG: FAD-dependent monooxygenase [Phycisphaeraceae bacterium]